MSNARKLRTDIIKLSALSTKQPSFYFIHGFFAGLAINPELIKPSQWYPELFGEVTFESEQQVSYSDSLMQLYNDIMQDCMQAEYKLPSQCKLPRASIEQALEQYEPLPQWSLGISTSFNLINTLTLGYDQLNALINAERCILAFSNYANLRAFTRGDPVWKSGAIALRRDLVWEIDKLFSIMRSNPVDLDEEAFLPEEFDLESEEIDEFDSLLESALYEDSEAAIASIPALIESFEQAMGEEYMRQQEGHFWLIHETRPYMMLRARRARLNFVQGDTQAAIEELQDLLRLNPNDNQGLRYALANWLVITQNWSALEQIITNYPEPSVPLLAAKALMLYAKAPNSPEANQAKKEALAANKHLLKYLTGQKKSKNPPELYQPGHSSEVEMYLHEYGKEAWRSVPGAMFWLRQKI